MHEEAYTIFMKEYIDFTNDAMLEADKSGNRIHPTAVIGADVILGRNNYIGAYCRIVGRVSIGDNNHFEAFVSVGSFPEHKHYKEMMACEGVLIGNNCFFKEFVSIHSGCTTNTFVGNDVWMLRGAYVAHDCQIMNGATLSANTMLGGYCHVGYGANLGMGCMVHQKSVIGGYSMVGMGTVVTKKRPILPGQVYVGNPARYLRENNPRYSSLSDYELRLVAQDYNDALIKNY